MATVGYSTNLSIVASAEAAEAWIEFTGAAGGGAPDETETECYIQGSGAVSQTTGATSGYRSMGFDLTSPRSIAAGDASFHWVYFGSPLALATAANSGMNIVIGNTIANWKAWILGGRDAYTYGGWLNLAVDPTCAADWTYGSPDSNTQVFGSLMTLQYPVAKGQPHVADVIRTGRTLICTGGQTGGYGTFVAAAEANDGGQARWGLCQAVQGGYLIKGRFQIGTNALCADFRDANRSLIIQDCIRVSPNFTIFEVNHADSRVDWTSISFLALGTNARGNFAASANADINIDSCTFTDMGTFSFDANSTINNSTFRRTDTITQSGATFAGCTFDSGRAAATIFANNPGLISSSSFVSDGSNHAIQIATLVASAAYTLTGLTYTGYAAPPSGSTGNECIYNNSGQHVKLSIAGGDEPSYRNGAGATTEIVLNQVALTITVKDATNTAIPSASCAIYKTSDDTQLMDEIGNASGVATEMFTYSSDTPVYWRVRRSTALTGTRYVPIGGNATITGTGLSITVTLYAEPLA